MFPENDESSHFCRYDITLCDLNLVRLFQQPIWNGDSTALLTDYGRIYVPDVLNLVILLLKDMGLPLELVELIMLAVIHFHFEAELDMKGFQYEKVNSFAEFPFLSPTLRETAESNSDELTVPGFGSAISLFPLVCGLDVIMECRPTRKFSNVCIVAMMQRLASNLVPRKGSEPKFQAIFLEAQVLPSRNWCTERIKHLGKNLGIDCVSPGTTTFCDSDRILIGSPQQVIDYLRESKYDTSCIQMCILDDLMNWSTENLDCDTPLLELASLLHANPIVPQWVIVNTSEHVLHLANLVSSFPLRICASHSQNSLFGVRQFYIACGKQEWKADVLSDLLDEVSFGQVVIWCNTRRRIDFLHEKLTTMGYSCAALHSDMDQLERNESLGRVRDGRARIVLCTDRYLLLSRDLNLFLGLYVSIHYDLPVSLDYYLHRCGRSGAYGRKSITILFVAEENTDEVAKVRQLESYYDTQITEMPADVVQYL